jgi:hypothetical protein
MTTMYEQARHEPLVEIEWDEERARNAIDQIVRDTHTHFDPQHLWPIHSLDRMSRDNAKPFRMLYFGAAGVIWALDYLNRMGATEKVRDYSSTLSELAAANRSDLSLSEPNAYSYLMGDSGISLLQWRANPSAELANSIYRAVESNTTNPAREFMWGAPGTMLVALFMHDFTGEERWKEVYVKNVREILSQLVKVKDLGCYTWTQDLYGRTSLYLGAVHGFAANIFSILTGRQLLDGETVRLVESLAADTLHRTAHVHERLANWPADVGGTTQLVQHCHGAPGMITCLVDVRRNANGSFDDLLSKGGELVWKAGPLIKGSNLCHGTAGNGYAFLKLYRRTAETTWLDRARAFAMHAIDQWERHSERYAQMRYSLWTGDLGLAIYLWDCIHGQANFPTMDVF